MNCTVQFKDGAATVWAPTQAPGFARAAVAKALGIDAEKVTLHVTYLGGGFGGATSSTSWCRPRSSRARPAARRCS